MRLPLLTDRALLGRWRPARRHALHRSAYGKPAQALLEDIDKDTVDFQDNYDNSERTGVACRFEFIVNGANGIVVGMATNAPPHNLGE